MLTTLQGIVLKFDDPKEFADILRTKKIGIYNLGPGIGDHVYHTYFPEVYYKNVGRKVVDLNKKWCYDFNPYVERDTAADVVICPWEINDRLPPQDSLCGSEFIFKPLGFDIPLRHPKLYRFEDLEKIPNSICIHTNGNSRHTTISDTVLNLIKEKYKNYQIFQIGGKNDKETGFIDKRGLSMWDTAELISKCQMFIGVNSGMLHIANCYPSVWKKIILDEFTNDELKTWHPCSTLRNSFWLDTSIMYFNQTERDIGITFSYKEI